MAETRRGCHDGISVPLGALVAELPANAFLIHSSQVLKILRGNAALDEKLPNMVQEGIAVCEAHVDM